MDHMEILAAAAVRDLAVKLRGSDIEKALAAGGFDGSTQQNRDSGNLFMAGWLERNPISLYVPQAYNPPRYTQLRHLGLVP